MTAVPLGVGASDVGLALGGIYQQETSSEPGTGSGTSRQTQIPAFEANAQLGVTPQVGVTLHASEAGLQPGVKITALHDPVMLAVIPQIGGGFVTRATATTSGGTTANGNAITSFTFLLGVRAVVSLPVGLYAGLGYDRQYISQAIRNANGTTTTDFQQAHNVGGAIGYELRVGSIALRPELAVLFTPLAKNQSNNGITTADRPDSSGLFLFPNITIAAVSTPQGK